MEKLKKLWKRIIELKTEAFAMIAWLLSCVIPLLVTLKRTWRNATEYKIAVFALLAWFLFEVAGRLWGIETYPVGYWQKIAFAIVSILIITGVSWLWLAKSFPLLKGLLDPDNEYINQLELWQKIKLAAFFFCFFVFCTVLLASLY